MISGPAVQFIVEVWKRTPQETVGAVELRLIQHALAERFGNAAMVSPASIARVLADHGACLGHPEILQADTRWREEHLTFSVEHLALTDIETATALMDKLNGVAPDEPLKQSVRQLKTELELLAASEKGDQKRRELAREVAQWLAVWLQNPPIFAEWLALRQATPDFRARFSS